MRRKSTCVKQRRDGNKDGHAKITDGFINMMGVRKEGEENLAPEEAIERLELRGRDEEKMKIAAKNAGKRIFDERNRRTNRNTFTLELHTENLFVCFYTKRLLFLLR